MKLPLVSIITNFYNAERFIKETIESVISQTYKNWELILFDDGSNDASTNIAKEFANKYPDKIFYFEHEEHQNKGTSASRNQAIANSSGEVVTFLDSDDIYLSNRLEEQIKLLNEFLEVGAIFSATKYWYGWKSPMAASKDYVQSLEIPAGIYHPPRLLEYFLTNKAVVPCMGGLTVRKKLIESCCWMEEQFKGMYDDQVFYSKLILNSSVYVDNNFYDLYRQHEDSCYSQARITNSVLKYELNFLKWLQNYINTTHNTQIKLKKTIQKKLRLIASPKIYNLFRRLNKIKRKIRILSKVKSDD